MFPHLLLNIHQEILKLFLVIDRVELWRTKFRWRRWNCKAQTFNSGFWASQIWKSKINWKLNSEPAKLELTAVGLPKRTSMMSGCRSESVFWYFFLAIQFEEISFVYSTSRMWLVRIKLGLRKSSLSFSSSNQLKWQLIEALTNAAFLRIQRRFSWYRSLMTFWAMTSKILWWSTSTSNRSRSGNLNQQQMRDKTSEHKCQRKNRRSMLDLNYHSKMSLKLPGDSRLEEHSSEHCL
jgi:hypothetical protein